MGEPTRIRHYLERIEQDSGDPQQWNFALTELVAPDGRTNYYLFDRAAFRRWRLRRGMLPVFEVPPHELCGPLPEDIQQRIGPRPRWAKFQDGLREAGLLPPEPPQST